MTTSLSDNERQSVAGVVLAGGQSRRMGGFNKSLLRWNHSTLLELVVQRAQPQVDRLLINANQPAEVFSRLNLPVIPDQSRADVKPFSGPLAGIVSAMQWYSQQQTAHQWLATFATDTPFIPEDFVRRCLSQARNTQAQVVYAQSGGRDHFALALWHMALLPALERHLIEGVHALKAVMSHHATTACEFSADPIDPFFNINTPEDWQKAQEILAHAEK